MKNRYQICQNRYTVAVANVSTGTLTISMALLLASCAQSSPSNYKSMAITQPAPLVRPSNVTTTPINWEHITAAADKLYQEQVERHAGIYAPHTLQGYADQLGTSTIETEHRLLIQFYSPNILAAIERELGDTVIGVYLVEDDSSNFSIITNVLGTSPPEQFIYTFKQSVLQGEQIPIDVRYSDKTESQVVALLNENMNEIWARYPDTQTVEYDPIYHAIRVNLYKPLGSETTRQTIENDLTKLVKHPITVHFMSAPLLF